VNFYRFLSIESKLTSPDYLSVTGRDQSPSGPHPYRRSNIYVDYSDTAGGAAPDTTFISFAGVKLMAHATVDPKPLFGSPEILGPEDLKVYGEVALLGLENDKAHKDLYGDYRHRMPVMAGFNIPAFRLLDVLSLEVEWYGAKFRDDVRRLRNGGNEPCVDGIHLGDNDRNQTLGGFVQFRLTDLMPGIVEYEYAHLYGERLGGQGKGDPRSIDPAHVREFSEDILLAGPDTAVGPSLGIFIQSLVDFPHVSVLPAMTSSYADDGLIQLRLRMEPSTTNLNGADDYFLIACGLELSVKYLAP
jgi:hypothetical protein